jgi:hypothetical protein
VRLASWLELAREPLPSRAEPLGRARKMTEPSLARLAAAPSHVEPSRAELGSARFQPYASYHSPYIPEYVGNHPAASVASASQPQASWQQPPPPPPIQPAYSRGQQPEGSQHTHQQRDFREESEARTVNSTVPESKHIY